MRAIPAHRAAYARVCDKAWETQFEASWVVEIYKGIGAAEVTGYKQYLARVRDRSFSMPR